MAAGDLKIVMIQGDPSTVPATAATAYNTAVQTLLTNAGGAIWLPVAAGGIPPVCLQAGCTVAPDAAVANDKYMFYGQFQYNAAS